MNRLIPALLLLAALPAGATTYTLEPNYTQVVLSWNHLGFSRPTAQIAQGTGTLDYDEKSPAMSRVTVTLPVASLLTGVPDLDEHLKSGDFFQADKYPSVTFTSARVIPGMDTSDLTVTGNLQIRDTVKPVTLHVKLLGIGTNERTHIASIGFSATATLKRSDFGLGAFVPQVADEIVLTITTQGAEARAYADYLRQQEKK
jgi:polyisoprenoid-binding protein YceI